MKIVRSILAAIDDSPRAPSVFKTAASLGRQLNAQVFLIRIAWIPSDIPPAAHVAPSGVEGFVEQAARDHLRALIATAPDVRFGPPIVVEGEPWRQILRASDEFDVDLIVIGNHRYHGLERLLGTVAATVVNHARRDVLVVHSRHDAG